MGGDFQFLDIIFFAMIAVFLVMRLRSVLGRRTGNEKQRDLFARRSREETRDKVIPLPDRTRPREEAQPDAPVGVEEIRPEDVRPEVRSEAAGTPLQQGIARIRSADTGFDPRGFMEGARSAFEMIVAAFAAGDTATLRPLLSDEVFENFRAAIEARRRANHTLETTLVGITSADMIEAELQGRTAVVTAKFVSEQVNVTRDAQGTVVDGDPATVTTVTDIWTFARNTRARDPNWALVATRSPN
jgi:predicted lipid-binding transport protein (Tim44 family)